MRLNERKGSEYIKHFGDITQLNGHELPIVDCVIGGSPCQDLSVAGKQKGIHEGERSNLFFEAIRIIHEMREATDHRYPRYAVWENVPGAFSSNGGEDFRAVLEEAAHIVEPECVIPRPENGKWTNAGCIVGDRWSIAWRVHDAQFWGVPQRRKRIALVADFGGLAAPEVLFERKGLSWNHKQSGETGKSPSGRTEGSLGKSISFQERSGALSAMNNQSVFSIAGNTIGRKVENGGNGGGAQQDICSTLNTVDRHAVAVDCRNFKEQEVNGTLQAKSNGGTSLNLNNVIRTCDSSE